MTLGKIGCRKLLKSGWVNPYVTDGLVAMWDGILNVGGNMPHDSTSNVWYDCIGGKQMYLARSTCLMGDTGPTVSQLTGQIAPELLGEISGDSTDYGWSYVEMTCSLEPFSSGRRYWSLFSFGNGRVIHGDLSIGKICFTTGAVSLQKVGDISTVPSTLHIGVDYGGMTVGASPNKAWINGSEIILTNGHLGWAPPSMNQNFMSNRDNYGTMYCILGTYHAIRLYNRPLTVAEMQQNTAVDKARFNLP